MEKWVALHDEEQHSTFDSILRALNYEIAKDFDSWTPPSKDEEEHVNITIYYPLVVLRGDLYSAVLKRGHISLKPLKHVQFCKQFISPRNKEVDVFSKPEEAAENKKSMVRGFWAPALNA